MKTVYYYLPKVILGVVIFVIGTLVVTSSPFVKLRQKIPGLKPAA